MKKMFGILLMGIVALTSNASFITSTADSKSESSDLSITPNQTKVNFICPARNISIEHLKASNNNAEAHFIAGNNLIITIICTENKIKTNIAIPQKIKTDFDYNQYLKDLLVLNNFSSLQSL